MKYRILAGVLALLLVFAGSFNASADIRIPEENCIGQSGASVALSVCYPRFGVPAIDEDIRSWAEGLATQFSQRYGRESIPPSHVPYQLAADYRAVRSPYGPISVVWKIARYTGSGLGKIEVFSANYESLTGTPLSLLDIFGSLEDALADIAAYVQPRIEHRLEGACAAGYNADGLGPEADNYGTFAVTSSGLRFYFQPGQVAPPQCGVLTQDVPLAVFRKCLPDTHLWRR